MHSEGYVMGREQERWRKLRVSTSVLSRFTHVQLLATSWTVVYQAPLSMRFSSQEYRNVLPFPSPWDLPHPGIKPKSLMSAALAGGFFTTSTTWEAHVYIRIKVYIYIYFFRFFSTVVYSKMLNIVPYLFYI